MAIDAKVSFIKQIEQRMQDILTVGMMASLVSAMRDVAEQFEMAERRHAEDGPDDMMDEYLSALKIQGRSPKTIELYRRNISNMMNYLKVPTRQITIHHIRNYLTYEKDRGLADSSVRTIRDILHSYFKWLANEGMIDQNPAANVGAIKVPKVQRKAYTEVEIENINQNCKQLRDRAIINFLGSTGCRIGEMIGLNRDDIDFKELRCVVHGKGNKERPVYMSQVAGMLLKQYLDKRNDDNPALFIGLRKNRLTSNGVRQMMKGIAKRTGIEHIHPHKFRRTLATGMIYHGMALEKVARILGHEKLDTTLRYVVLNDDDVRTDYRRYA